MSKLSLKQLSIDGSITNAQISNTAGIQQSKISNLESDLADKVETSVQINGQALTANITLDTDDISEALDATNLWFTTARAQSAISVSGDLGYTDGEISFTERTDSEVQALITSGTGVTVSSGQVSIGQAVGPTDNVTFADLTVTGDLTITGSIDQYNVTELLVEDQSLKLNSGVTGAPSLDAEIIVESGTSSDVYIKWDENNDKWVFGSVNPDDGSVASVDAFFAHDIPQYAGKGLKFDGGDGASNQFELNVANEYLSIAAADIPASGPVSISLSSTPVAQIDEDSGVTAIYLNGLKLKRQVGGTSLGASYDARIKQGASASDPAEIEIDRSLCSDGDEVEIVFAAIAPAE